MVADGTFPPGRPQVRDSNAAGAAPKPRTRRLQTAWCSSGTILVQNRRGVRKGVTKDGQISGQGKEIYRKGRNNQRVRKSQLSSTASWEDCAVDTNSGQGQPAGEVAVRRQKASGFELRSRPNIFLTPFDARTTIPHLFAQLVTQHRPTAVSISLNAVRPPSGFWAACESIQDPAVISQQKPSRKCHRKTPRRSSCPQCERTSSMSRQRLRTS